MNIALHEYCLSCYVIIIIIIIIIMFFLSWRYNPQRGLYFTAL